MDHKLGTAREKARTSEVPLDSSISRKGSGACYPSDLVRWADNSQRQARQKTWSKAIKCFKDIIKDQDVYCRLSLSSHQQRLSQPP